MPDPTVAELQRLKDEIGKLEAALSEVSGSLKQLGKQVQLLGFKTLNEAQAALPELREELANKIGDVDAALSAFWQDRIKRLEEGTGSIIGPVPTHSVPGSRGRSRLDSSPAESD